MTTLKPQKKLITRFIFPIIISLFLFLHLWLISAFAQEGNMFPLYGKMEQIQCREEIGISELLNSCLLYFESIDGSPKFGIIYDADTFFYNTNDIKNRFGYVDREYFEFLKNSMLLYQLQSQDDSYFYVRALDNGMNSLTILDDATIKLSE